MSAGTFKAEKTGEPIKALSARIPLTLFEKIEADKWDQRKSVNQLIVEALEKAFK